MEDWLTVQELIDKLMTIEDKTKLVTDDHFCLPIVGIEEDGRYVELISSDDYGERNRRNI